MARLIIVHDHRTLVELLELELSQVGHEVVGHCWRADQVLPAAETDHDVVLMRLDLPSDINTAPLVGLALTEALLERDPTERVLLYQTTKDRSTSTAPGGWGLRATCRSPDGSASSRRPSRLWRQAGSSGRNDLLHLPGHRHSRSREPHGPVPLAAARTA